MRVSIGGDHADPALKKVLIDHLKNKGVRTINRGTDTTDSVDYPDFAHAVSVDVEEGEADWGILICGSANGVAMTANKHKGVRAAICWSEEIASLAKQHNNANIISIPSRFLKEEEILNIVDVFVKKEFEGGRHERRIKKIDNND